MPDGGKVRTRRSKAECDAEKVQKAQELLAKVGLKKKGGKKREKEIKQKGIRKLKKKKKKSESEEDESEESEQKEEEESEQEEESESNVILNKKKKKKKESESDEDDDSEDCLELLDRRVVGKNSRGGAVIQYKVRTVSGEYWRGYTKIRTTQKMLDEFQKAHEHEMKCMRDGWYDRDLSVAGIKPVEGVDDDGRGAGTGGPKTTKERGDNAEPAEFCVGGDESVSVSFLHLKSLLPQDP